MTIRDLINNLVELQGYIKIQCWENEDNPTIYYEGYNIYCAGEYLDREIHYIYPIAGENDGVLIIEVREDETQ